MSNFGQVGNEHRKLNWYYMIVYHNCTISTRDYYTGYATCSSIPTLLSLSFFCLVCLSTVFLSVLLTWTLVKSIDVRPKLCTCHSRTLVRCKLPSHLFIPRTNYSTLNLTGACAGYTCLYAIWYNLTELDMDGIIPMILYCSYMGVFAATVFLVTGTIGFTACFWFNLQIYGSIKVD